jgi:hypothetical protein
MSDSRVEPLSAIAVLAFLDAMKYSLLGQLKNSQRYSFFFE